MSISTLPQPALLTFLEHLEVERNVSQLTIRNYSHYLRRFVDWFLSEGYTDLKQLDQDVLRKYRVYLARLTNDQDQELANSTQSYHIIALRSFLKYLVKQDCPVLHPEKIDLPKADAKHMEYLSNQEYVERFLAQPDLDSKTGLRDRAMLEVLFSTGLRVSELVSLNRDQLNVASREFGVIGKGRRPRVVFLSDRAADWLGKWLNSRADEWRPVFIRFAKRRPDPMSDGEEMRLTTRSVQRVVDKYARQAHLPVKISPHGLRHTFATDLLANGAGLRDVQEMLGHKNIATTQIYTHVTQPKLKQTHKKFHTKF